MKAVEKPKAYPSITEPARGASFVYKLIPLNTTSDSAIFKVLVELDKPLFLHIETLESAGWHDWITLEVEMLLDEAVILGKQARKLKNE